MNEYLQRLISGYYNFSKPKSFNGVEKPHYTDDINKIEQLKRMSQGYYNLTPPVDYKGNIMPHYKRSILEDRTINLPKNFLNAENRMRYYLSQDLENLGQRVGPLQKQPTLLDLVRSLF